MDVEARGQDPRGHVGYSIERDRAVVHSLGEIFSPESGVGHDEV